MGLRDKKIDRREGNALEKSDIGDGKRQQRTRKVRYETGKRGNLLSLTVKCSREPAADRE